MKYYRNDRDMYRDMYRDIKYNTPHTSVSQPPGPGINYTGPRKA